jgi:tyrosine-protein kinase Etk/Wzc
MNGPNLASSDTHSARDGVDDEINLLDLLQVVVENLRLLLLAPLALGLLALGISYLVQPTFTAATRFMPPQQQQIGAAIMLQSLGAIGGLASAAAGLKNPNDQFVGFLQSETIANALVERFDLVQRYDSEFKVDARISLAKLSNISAGKDGLISVEVDDKDPAFAAQLANAYVEELGTLLSRLAVTEAQQRRAFFEAQLNETKSSLVKAELALKGSGVNSSALKSIPDVAVKAVAELQTQIAGQEIKLSSLRGYLAETAPDFKQALTELTALRGQLAKLERSTSAPTTAADADYLTRYRDFKYYETLYALFAKQYELAKIDEAREGAVIQVVDAALPPERKSKPKKAQIAVLTTLASGMLLLLFIFVRQSLRNSRENPASAERMNRLGIAWRRAVGRA